MASFSRIEVTTKMKATGIVPVFFHPDIHVCKEIVNACYKGGVRVFEFTNRGDGAHLVFEQLLAYIKDNFPDMILGIGSIVDAPTAGLYIQLGTNFIVSPILNPEIGRVCNRRKIAWMPGCGSVTEISYAEELGAEVVKIFPGLQVGGPGFVKGVKGPMPWTSIMPTGDVTPSKENLEGWFDAGVHCVGLGSALITREILKNGDYLKLQSEVENAYGHIKRYLAERYLRS